MAPVGQNQLKSFQFMAEHFNKKNAGRRQVRDRRHSTTRLSPQESAERAEGGHRPGHPLHRAGQRLGRRAGASSTRVNKHNERNPGKEVLYLNYAAVDPDLTNSKCSYWHFRLDADTSMKMEALTTFMKDQPDVKKVYLINQNYSHGQQVAKFAKENLARKRPDIQIVGDDLHPLGPGARTSRPTSPRSRPPAPTRSSPATGAPTWRC